MPAVWSKTLKRFARLVPTLGLAVSIVAPAATASEPPSVPGLDAPELARLGPYGVGLRRIELVQPGQPDLAALDPKTGAAPLKDRRLPVSLWYPAIPATGAPTATYAGWLPPERPDRPPVRYAPAAIAVVDAPPAGGRRFPLVILSHGYSGAAEALTWLGENLASKGYVVAAISHGDPPYGDARGFAEPLIRRPLDLAFVARSLQSRARSGGDWLSRIVDPGRVALIGYSMGGYGVLTEAAGGFDPAGLAAHALPSAYIAPYLPGGAQEEALRIDGLGAVVALSPFTGLPGSPALSPEAVGRIRTPLLLIAGDRDHVVGFAGVRAVFDQALAAPRRLLVFENADHSIGMTPAPDTVPAALWDLDWFEDPVWRKDRVLGVSLHIITAFLDRYVKGDESRAAYLDVAIPRSNDGVWPAGAAGAYGRYSSGAAPITVWKGFQRDHSAGLELWRGDPVR